MDPLAAISLSRSSPLCDETRDACFHHFIESLPGLNAIDFVQRILRKIVRRPHRVEEKWIAAPPGEEAVLSGRGYRAQGTTDAIVQSSKGSSIDQLSNLPASQ